ncbi:MAG: lipid-binding SYLF domain-containing protein [Alphaproteobacteria bacterium]|nr:lipid-binding SYLF domain-containing protein [Acidobacteriaceae bacterium]MBV9375980.1 lipid-binding SYLF domain-containing protein [Alphaproteobacteria bacterium]
MLATSGLIAAAKNEPVERIREAARVFNEIQGVKEKAVPDTLLSKADGIIIVPGLKRAGFVVGGQYGKGVFVARLPNGRWSAPSTVRIEGGSFGAQIGAGETDLIMLAMNEDAVKQLMKMGVKIGGDVMAAAGPLGREAGAATTPIPTSGLLAYSRARGVFAGATVNGSTMRSDDDDNAAIYGRRVDQSDILTGKVKPTPAAQPLLAALRRYFRANPSTKQPPKKSLTS